MKVLVRRLPHAAGWLELPSYATLGSVGIDLSAACAEPIILWPGQRVLVPTGFSVEIPPGFELQIRPRSGLAAKHGITVLNSPGTIDSDYRGEIKVLLFNAADPAVEGSAEFWIERGMRIAQAVVCPVVRVELEEVDELPSTERGEGGFGSTGA